MLKSLPREVPEMDMLNLVDLNNIAEMAAGMSMEEILDMFSMDRKDFSVDEEVYFVEFFNYGRGLAKAKVINNLIESTKGRQGQAAALSYLRRFAKEFEKEVEGDSSGSFSFQFGEAK